MLPDVCEGKIRWKGCVLVGAGPYEGIGSTLAFSLGDCTIGTSYVTHTSCILCIIHHIRALAPKLASLRKAMHTCSCGKCMWHKHTHLDYLLLCIYAHTVCFNVFEQRCEKKNLHGRDVNKASHPFVPIKTQLHIRRDGTRNQMRRPLNQWFADYYCAFGCFKLP